MPIFKQNEQLSLFRHKFTHKRILGLEFWKTKPGCRISSSKISCVPNFRQNGQLWTFWPKFTQEWVLGSEFWKTNSGYRISSSKIPCVPTFRQNGQLWIFRPKFPQKRILGSGFWKTMSGSKISLSKILCVSIFRQNGQLWIFGFNLEKLPNYVQYFGSNNVQGVQRAGWRWIEMGGCWNELGFDFSKTKIDPNKQEKLTEADKTLLLSLE